MYHVKVFPNLVLSSQHGHIIHSDTDRSTSEAPTHSGNKLITISVKLLDLKLSSTACFGHLVTGALEIRHWHIHIVQC